MSFQWLRDYQIRGLRVLQEYGSVSLTTFQQNNVYAETLTFMSKHGLAVERQGSWELTAKGADALACGRFEMVNVRRQMTETGRVA